MCLLPIHSLMNSLDLNVCFQGIYLLYFTFRGKKNILA